MKNTKFEILLYYKYVQLSDPDSVRDTQRALCEKLSLKGRIIVATEGINGTVEGTKENTQEYINAMHTIKEFAGITYKRSIGTGVAFPKLSVRTRPEIVTTGIQNLDVAKGTGKYLSSEKLHEWFEQKKEFYIVDMRNDYEYSSGFFDNFIPSGLKNFFDLKDVLPRLSHLKNKTIVTVCTGGVRCEKASGLLVQNGFADVYQLQDGIQTYMEKYPNQHFKGKLYVFDKRITIGFNTDDPSHVIVGKCMLCEKFCDTYVNCEYNECHHHYISCKDCRDKETGFAFCDKECKVHYIAQQKKRDNNPNYQQM